MSLRPEKSPEGREDAEVDVLRYADRRRADEALAEMEALRGETGQRDGCVIVFGLYRSGASRRLVGARP